MPSDLSSEERDLVARVTMGEPVHLFPDHGPDAPAGLAGRALAAIPATLVRDMLLGGFEGQETKAKGVRLDGARITGALDLSSLTSQFPLHLTRCVIEERIDMDGYRGRSVVLDGSVLWKGMDALRAHIDGTLSMRLLERDGAKWRFESHGKIDLKDARVEGTMSLRAACLRPDADSDRTLIGDRMKIRGSLFLSAETDAGNAPIEGGVPFESFGVVRLPGAEIGGSVYCQGGRFAWRDPPAPPVPTGPPPQALHLSHATIGGSLWLSGFRDNGQAVDEGPVFHALGVVNLALARIECDLSLENAVIELPGRDGLAMRGTRVEGRTSLRHRTRLETWADLRAFRTGLYHQHWEPGAVERDRGSKSAKPSFVPERMRIGGLEVGRIEIDEITPDGRRKGNPYRILVSLLDASREDGFDPAIHRSFADLLSRSGYRTGAASIEIRRRRGIRRERIETLRRRTEWRGCGHRARKWGNACLFWVADCLFEVGIGYGYKPERVVVATLVVIVAGWWVIDRAETAGAMIPADPYILRSEAWLECVAAEEATGTPAVRCWMEGGAAPPRKAAAQGKASAPVQAAMPEPGSDPQAAAGDGRDPARDLAPEGTDYLRLQPLVYSVDAFVPFVSLRQEARWRPSASRGGRVGRRTSLYLGFHALAGWIVSALAAAGVATILRR